MRIDTIGELIEALEGLDPDTPIKMALQPNYPMKGSLENVCVQRDADGEEKTVWLACSDNEDYGCPSEVWDDDEIADDPEDDDPEDDEDSED